MHILILANNDVGLYKFRRELVEELLKSHEVTIALPYGDLIPKLQELGCQYIPFEFRRRGMNPFADLWQIHRYRKLLRTLHPNVVLTYTIKPNVYGGTACQLENIPYIANVTGLGTAVENGGLVQRITIILYRMGLAKAYKVFFQNNENKDFMLSHNIVTERYEIIPGSGVNLNQYQVTEYPKGEINNFFFIGRVMKEKGIDQFLEAAIEVKKKYTNVEFHVCGFCEQRYESKLKSLTESGIINYHGLVQDTTEMYAIASCVVLPTYYPEGINNVLLESAASGRPIITTNRSGCKEVVDDGVNGFIVKEKCTQDLVQKIEAFLQLSYDEKRKMGLEGRMKVEKEFNRNYIIDKYISVISNLQN